MTRSLKVAGLINIDKLGHGAEGVQQRPLSPKVGATNLKVRGSMDWKVGGAKYSKNTKI